VVGAGAVGLAIARKLAGRDGTSTLLIERHGAVGTETSSRNSEVRVCQHFYTLAVADASRSSMLAYTMAQPL
jgi:glycine/D-amino acid oxidase-like deaminating enzyme